LILILYSRFCPQPLRHPFPPLYRLNSRPCSASEDPGSTARFSGNPLPRRSQASPTPPPLLLPSPPWNVPAPLLFLKKTMVKLRDFSSYSKRLSPAITAGLPPYSLPSDPPLPPPLPFKAPAFSYVGRSMLNPPPKLMVRSFSSFRHQLPHPTTLTQ